MVQFALQILGSLIYPKKNDQFWLCFVNQKNAPNLFGFLQTKLYYCKPLKWKMLEIGVNVWARILQHNLHHAHSSKIAGKSVPYHFLS